MSSFLRLTEEISAGVSFGLDNQITVTKTAINKNANAMCNVIMPG